MSLKEKLSSVGGIVAHRALSYGSGESVFAGLREETSTTLGLNENGFADWLSSIVTSFIALAIVISIGVIILSSVQQAMPAVNESSPYYALQNTLETTTASGYGLIAIVIIIVAAAAIMGAIGLIRRGGQE
jgi:hypothetical protein